MNTTTGAPLWRRFAALLYDTFALAALSMLYSALMTGLFVTFFGIPKESFGTMFGGNPVFALGWISVITFFYVWFWRRSGQTIGMRTWRLKLVSAQTPDIREQLNQLTWKTCLQRALWGAFGFWGFGVAYWYRWFDSQGDCLHDKCAKTRVIVLPKPQKV